MSSRSLLDVDPHYPLLEHFAGAWATVEIMSTDVTRLFGDCLNIHLLPLTAETKGEESLFRDMLPFILVDGELPS